MNPRADALRLLLAAAVTGLVLFGCAKPPVIDSITIDPNPVPPSTVALVTAVAHSPSGEGLIYYWSADAGEMLQTTGNPVQFKAPKLTGTYRIALHLLDSHEKVADDTLEFEVRNPVPE